MEKKLEKKITETEEIEKALASDKPVIVPYAYSADQEYMTSSRMPFWDDVEEPPPYPDYDNDPDGAWNKRASPTYLNEAIKVREDGFVQNLKTGGIYYANNAAMAILRDSIGMSIEEVKRENAEILNILRIN